MPQSVHNVSSPPRDRPVMLYDAECHFCGKWIARWREQTAGRIEYTPYQESLNRFPEIPEEQCQEAVQLVDTDGRVYSAAEAVFQALKERPFGRRLLRLYRRSTVFARLAEWGYHLIARHRYFFSIFTQLLWGKTAVAPTYRFSGWLFFRLFGAVSLIAFLSFWVQAAGLVGVNGIYPLAEHLNEIQSLDESGRLNRSPLHVAPSLFWIAGNDAALHAVLGSGVAFSALLILGLAPPLTVAAVWVLYLSLAAAVPVFLSFQWDILLLEAAFMGFWMAPLAARQRLNEATNPSRIGRFLVLFLLFRLMFESGVGKLNSYGPGGENAWQDLTALDDHYFTQPLPTGLSWYFHQLPHEFHAASIVIMFVIELAIPFLIFGPRRVRSFACGVLILFQLLIMATGNYGFFNLLTIVLCVLLIDDQSLPSWLQRRLPTRSEDARPARAGIALTGVRTVVLIFVLLVGGTQLLQSLKLIQGRHDTPAHRPEVPAPIESTMATIAPFRSINTYGLFRVMTTERPEIVIEGSRDGVRWEPYVFKWKPGDPSERPRYAIPHMPRLDWQMWFAALQPDYRQTRQQWFGRLVQALFEARPEVLNLLERAPFPDEGPRYIRASRYRYTFTDFATRRETGRWWDRELIGRYSPTFEKAATRIMPPEE